MVKMGFMKQELLMVAEGPDDGAGVAEVPDDGLLDDGGFKDDGTDGGVAVGGPDDGMAEGIDDGLLDGTGMLGGGELVGALV